MARRPKPWFRKARNAWFVMIGGVQHNLGPDKNEAYDRFHQLMRQPQQRKVSSQSFAAIAEAFLEWVQKHRAPDTYGWYQYRIKRFHERYPDLRACDMRPYHVSEWADSYHLSTTSRRNYLRSVKRCMKWAKRQGYIQDNPIADLEVPAAEHKEIVITQDEFQTILSYIRDDTFEDLILTTWESGCRPQESLIVEARHVDLANQRWVFRKSEEKTKRITRVVYLTDKALAITKRLMVRYRDGGPLFRNINGNAWTTYAVNCAFIRLQIRMGKDEMKRRGEMISNEQIKALIPTLNPEKRRGGEAIKKTAAELRAEAKRKLTNKRAAELAPKYSLYAIRHSWATHALERGVDPLTVAILMGHRDPSTLAKVYQHLSLNPEHLLQQAKKAAG